MNEENKEIALGNVNKVNPDTGGHNSGCVKHGLPGTEDPATPTIYEQRRIVEELVSGMRNMAS